jgi:hypothetical protein
LEHRHPLQDPSLPEHPTKNKPDKTKPANVELGKKWVQELGLANAKDIIKMVRNYFHDGKVLPVDHAYLTKRRIYRIRFRGSKVYDSIND